MDGLGLKASLLLALAAIAGCLSDANVPQWQIIHEHNGVNSCEGPGSAHPSNARAFDVDHERMIVNVSVELDAGLVEFELANPAETVVGSREFSGPGSASFDIDNLTAGRWEARITCPTGLQFGLEWHVTVTAWG